jgi:hypothetical protein
MFTNLLNNGTVNTIWDGNNNEIFLYDGSSITQLTDNSYDDSKPHINAKGYIVWSGYDGIETEIFMEIVSELISSTFFIVWWFILSHFICAYLYYQSSFFANHRFIDLKWQSSI